MAHNMKFTNNFGRGTGFEKHKLKFSKKTVLIKLKGGLNHELSKI